MLALCAVARAVCLCTAGVCRDAMRATQRAEGAARWLGTPKLVRETSRRRWWQRGGPEKSVEDVKRDFSDIVLPPALQARRAPFEHMLCRGL